MKDDLKKLCDDLIAENALTELEFSSLDAFDHTYHALKHIGIPKEDMKECIEYLARELGLCQD